jgi:hypothetical protein
VFRIKLISQSIIISLSSSSRPSDWSSQTTYTREVIFGQVLVTDIRNSFVRRRTISSSRDLTCNYIWYRNLCVYYLSVNTEILIHQHQSNRSPTTPLSPRSSSYILVVELWLRCPIWSVRSNPRSSRPNHLRFQL